jgi:hypothetical protein
MISPSTPTMSRKLTPMETLEWEVGSLEGAIEEPKYRSEYLSDYFKSGNAEELLIAMEAGLAAMKELEALKEVKHVRKVS